MIDLGKPIVVFYANMLKIGIRLRVVDGQLRVKDTQAIMTPVIRAEIEKRADHLIELLSPTVPVELQPYFWRLITVKEVVEVMGIAERLQVGVKTVPANGGWVALMSDYFVPAKPKTKSKVRRGNDGAQYRKTISDSTF